MRLAWENVGSAGGEFAGIGDCIRGELDGPLVEGCEEGLCEGCFGHDVGCEVGVEGGLLTVGRGGRRGGDAEARLMHGFGGELMFYD